MLPRARKKYDVPLTKLLLKPVVVLVRNHTFEWLPAAVKLMLEVFPFGKLELVLHSSVYEVTSSTPLLFWTPLNETTTPLLTGLTAPRLCPAVVERLGTVGSTSVSKLLDELAWDTTTFAPPVPEGSLAFCTPWPIVSIHALSEYVPGATPWIVKLPAALIVVPALA